MGLINRTTGQIGEELAAKFLRRNGFKILKKNYKTRLGEIDILASEKNDIVVVEVKTKSTNSFGQGYEMVNYFKKNKLLMLARDLQKEYSGKTVRIDVISIDLAGGKPDIKLFRNAVQDD
jgi:putative endonuclease